jgi:hypothetical protein
MATFNVPYIYLPPTSTVGWAESSIWTCFTIGVPLYNLSMVLREYHARIEVIGVLLYVYCFFHIVVHESQHFS